MVKCLNAVLADSVPIECQLYGYFMNSRICYPNAAVLYGIIISCEVEAFLGFLIEASATFSACDIVTLRPKWC